MHIPVKTFQTVEKPYARSHAMLKVIRMILIGSMHLAAMSTTGVLDTVPPFRGRLCDDPDKPSPSYMCNNASKHHPGSRVSSLSAHDVYHM